MNRARWTCACCGAVVVLARLLVPAPAFAQLRPYDPFPWEIFDAGNVVVAHAGVDAFWGQRASLAGTEGRLLELGSFQAVFRTGRVALEAAGTFQREFREDEVFADPDPDVVPSDGTRSDWGDFRVATTVLLTPPDRSAIGVVRFGTRLPTSDNGIGLERDRTDFFALLGGRIDHGPIRVTAEAGAGIDGTRLEAYEQSDVFVYGLGVSLPRARVIPSLQLIGHADGLAGRAIRGNEELSEVRLGLRTSGPLWARVQAVRGLTDFSPRWGLSVSLGLTM